ncbi:MAG: heme-binding Shp domain-containing protein [Coprobacillaceae bacterium]
MSFILIIKSAPIVALEDGAYTVGRTTSYPNPETGQTADGGTNIALGDSMCASIVENHLLVEQVNGKTYVTIGIGLMSNVSNVRMQVQTSAGGGYSSVGLTYTGASTKDGDTCNHYRFEVVSPDLYISPILYVEPMGRDVQFFVKLNMGGATSGTGVFNSLMATTQTPVTNDPVIETPEEVIEVPEETPEVLVEPINFEEMYKNATGLTMYENAKEVEVEKENSTPTSLITLGVIGVSGCGVIGYFVYKKKSRGAS